MSFKHGASGYQNFECRCNVCTKGNRIKQRQLRKRLKKQIPRNHGASTYTNWSCRCDICKAGHAKKVKRKQNIDLAREVILLGGDDLEIQTILKGGDLE